MKIKALWYLIISVVAITLAGCGSGGGGGGGTTGQAIVKLATSGTLPVGRSIGSIQNVTVTYPTNKGMAITQGNVVMSGVASGSFAAANVSTNGQVGLGAINSTGFGIGEFATLTFNYSAGNAPLAGEFAIASGAAVYDTTTAALPGISVVILSVTIL